MAFLVYPSNSNIAVLQIDADDYRHVLLDGVENGFEFIKTDERIPVAYFPAGQVAGIVKA